MLYGELEPIETSDNSNGEPNPGVPGVPVAILNPPKLCLLRLPTPDELVTYQSKQRSLRRKLGRRQEEWEEIPNPEADRRLFTAIRLDRSGAEFDDAEILYALNFLNLHSVESCERDGDSYTISLRTRFGTCTHTVRIPFQREHAEYNANCVKSRSLPHNVDEVRFPPDAPNKLYDAIIQSVSGYSDQLNVIVGNGKEDTSGKWVPVHHKRAVVSELLSAIGELDPALDPNS